MAYVNFQAPAEQGKDVIGEIKSALSEAGASILGIKRDEKNPDRIAIKTKDAGKVRSALVASGYTV